MEELAAAFLAWYRRLTSPTRIKLALPRLTRREGSPVNFELKDDTIATITIHTVDAGGTLVPPPTGDTFSVVSSDPTKLKAVIGVDVGGNPAVVLTPLVRIASGLTITVSDTAHLTSDVQNVDIVEDLTPATIVLDIANATFMPQPTPLT